LLSDSLGPLPRSARKQLGLSREKLGRVRLQQLRAILPRSRRRSVVLNDRKVHFVLVGGYALAVHGVVRATADIDCLYRRTIKNVRQLCAAPPAH
jgi:hypothetical protein